MRARATVREAQELGLGSEPGSTCLPRDNVALCRHGRRTPLVEHQRQLAEGNATRRLHDGALARHCDVARAGLEHVELIALVALLDDHLAWRELDLLHGLHQHLAGARGGVGLTGWAESKGES